MPFEGLVYIKEQQQKELAGYIGKLLRDSFGKGPEGVFVSAGGSFLTIYLRNFISPIEQILLEQDDDQTVVTTREKLMSKLIPDIRAAVEFITGIELREVYYDWGLHNRSGMIIGVATDSFAVSPVNEDYIGKQEIHCEIDSISHQVQKRPSEIYSCELNQRTLIVVRNGILVAIERELIRLGYEVMLKYAKQNLEKRYLHNNNHFESILKRKIIDLFVDWDFERDKSLIVFALNALD